MPFLLEHPTERCENEFYLYELWRKSTVVNYEKPSKILDVKFQILVIVTRQ